MEMQSHTEVVQASAERCFDTITDFAKYPQWFSGIEDAEVEQSDPEAGLWTVRYQLHMVVRSISYTLDYRGERPSRLTWKLARGDVNDIEGSYDFVRLEPELTEATCAQAIDIGFWVPGPIRRGFERSALADSVREFKRAAEA